MKYEIGYRNSIDLDAEQTEARYDQGMLSDIMNDDQVEMQKAESCVADNFKYDHGQKIQRYDPCEICLCIDGEIFCWWKQCDVPTKPQLNGNPPGPERTPMTTTTAYSHMLPVQPQLPATAAAVGASSSSTVLPLPSRMTSEVTTLSTPAPQPPSAAAPSYPDQQQPDSNVRILHPQPAENIPRNILSFPQSPPIMMYRPVGVGKNVTSFSAAAAIERNKHGGPPKKVNPLHLNNGEGGKKPYRKSKSKGYVINYGRIEGDEGRVFAVTERIASDGRRVPMNDGSRSYEVDRSGNRLMGGGGTNDGDDENDDDDDDDDDDDEEDESEEGEERGEIDGVSRNRGVSSSSGGRDGDEFGGFGYGMMKEPEEDKQQHYIITSSGHVEMFDDTSMEATENAFGMNRLPLMVGSGSTTTTQPVAMVLGGSLEDHHEQATSSSTRAIDEPIPPLITMTTNVTQYSNYSNRLPDVVSGVGQGSGGSPPLTPFAPLSSGSIIDVLNSTVDGDYLDDNQTELIYPAVPGLSGSSSSSSSSSGGTRGGTVHSGGRQAKTAGAAAVTTTSSAGRSATEQHCVVMGVSYKVGSVLKQETGNCLHCVCVAGPENDPVPRVTCTPLNCPPLILPDILDGAGF